MKLGIYSTAAYLLIFVAAVAALVSFLGCCGAAKVQYLIFIVLSFVVTLFSLLVIRLIML